MTEEDPTADISYLGVKKLNPSLSRTHPALLFGLWYSVRCCIGGEKLFFWLWDDRRSDCFFSDFGVLNYQILPAGISYNQFMNGSLLISSVDKSSEGTYTCTAQNGIRSPIAKTVNVTVNGKATFLAFTKSRHFHHKIIIPQTFTKLQELHCVTPLTSKIFWII